MEMADKPHRRMAPPSWRYFADAIQEMEQAAKRVHK
jgi:hypothetical protein